MPRQPRKFIVGEIYHVINRGVDKQNIFLKYQDFSRFIIALEFFNQKAHINLWKLLVNWSDDVIDTLTWSGLVSGPKMGAPMVAQRLMKSRKDRKTRNDQLVEIIGFVLMPNHFHLILREIKEGGISEFMQKLGGYITYFNKQYKRLGVLFQSRYKSIHIKTDHQLQVLFNYVHTNPVELNEPGWKNFKVKNKKKAILDLKEYRWSSYRDYIGLPTHPFVTQRDFFHNTIGDHRECQASVEGWVYEKAKLEGPGTVEVLGE